MKNFKKIRENAIKHDKAIQNKEYEEERRIWDLESDPDNTDEDKMYYKHQQSKTNNIFSSMSSRDFYELLTKINHGG